MPRRAPAAPARARRGAERLSRDRIVETAIALADRDGIETLSMRRLAAELGVDPMSIYNHLDDKNALLAAMADSLIATIDIAPSRGDWRDATRQTILRARSLLAAHPWSKGVIESLAVPTPSGLRYLDAMLGVLREADFSLSLTHRAIHVLGSRMLGFSQDLYDLASRPATPEAVAQSDAFARTLPRLAELGASVEHGDGLGGCDTDEEFEFVLDLLLDGLERIRVAEASANR